MATAGRAIGIFCKNFRQRIGEFAIECRDVGAATHDQSPALVIPLSHKLDANNHFIYTRRVSALSDTNSEHFCLVSDPAFIFPMTTNFEYLDTLLVDPKR